MSKFTYVRLVHDKKVIQGYFELSTCHKSFSDYLARNDGFDSDFRTQSRAELKSEWLNSYTPIMPQYMFNAYNAFSPKSDTDFDRLIYLIENHLNP